jgi:inner membrane protein involved in colicin E2 resistance
MERTFRDDLKWALAVLAGAALGYFILGGEDTAILLGSFVGAVVVICAVAVLRRITHRRKA